MLQLFILHISGISYPRKHRTSHSKELKESMVVKLCTPGGPSVFQLSKDSGISKVSLYKWRQAHGGIQLEKKLKPDDWDPNDQLKAVFKAEGLSEPELGEYLRKAGLLSDQIEEWKREALAGVTEKRKRGRPKKDPELVSLETEVKLLKRDLRRKDRALAEQTAIVILQKKAQQLWGTDEDDE